MDDPLHETNDVYTTDHKWSVNLSQSYNDDDDDDDSKSTSEAAA